MYGSEVAIIKAYQQAQYLVQQQDLRLVMKNSVSMGLQYITIPETKKFHLMSTETILDIVKFFHQIANLVRTDYMVGCC